MEEDSSRRSSSQDDAASFSVPSVHSVNSDYAPRDDYEVVRSMDYVPPPIRLDEGGPLGIDNPGFDDSAYLSNGSEDGAVVPDVDFVRMFREDAEIISLGFSSLRIGEDITQPGTLERGDQLMLDQPPADQLRSNPAPHGPPTNATVVGENANLLPPPRERANNSPPPSTASPGSESFYEFVRVALANSGGKVRKGRLRPRSEPQNRIQLPSYQRYSNPETSFQEAGENSRAENDDEDGHPPQPPLIVLDNDESDDSVDDAGELKNEFQSPTKRKK